MGFKARQQGGNFKPLEPGIYAGVCTTLVDVGMQDAGKFGQKYKVVLGFTLPGKLKDNGEPYTISETVTNSMDKKANLRKWVESWFGKGFPSEEAAKDFDLTKLLGKVAYVNVINKERNGNVYANISGLVPLPKELPQPTFDGDKLFYTDEMVGEERSKAYAALPEWIRKKVDEQIRAEEPVDVNTTAKSDAQTDDDIPF